MSINSIISNSLTGLFTNQAALRTISSNIANINTPGYARQVVRLESIVNGAQAGGVKISGIERIVDKFLVKSVYNANGDFAKNSIQSSFHSRVQSLLGRPDQNNSLAGRIDGVFSAISDMALNPLSAILKESTLSTINQFGAEVGMLVDQIQNMRMDASSKIAENVARINALTKQIEGLNPLIMKETLTSGDPGALIEKRAQALTELSSIIDLNVADTGNNGVLITTASGITLLGGARRSVLVYSPPSVVSASTPFQQIKVHQLVGLTDNLRPSNQYLDADLKSGELKGLLTLRDKDLPDMALQLGSLAAGFTDALNGVHNLNTAVPAPNNLTGENTGILATDNHNFTGGAVFAITDTSGNLVSKVTIDFSAVGPTMGNVIAAVNAGLGGNGTMAMTNGVLSFTATAGSNGVSISQADGNGSDRAGRGFSHFFGMNNLVEAKVPAHFETGIVGTDAHGFVAGDTLQLEILNSSGETLGSYGLTIGGTTFDDILANLNGSSLGASATFSFSGKGKLIVTPTAAAGGDIKLHVKTDSTTRGTTGTTLSAFFGIGDTFRTEAALDLKVRKVIDDNPSRLALAQFDQTAVVGGNALSIGDQTGALALQDLGSMTYKFDKAGGLGDVTLTLAQYSADLLANFGLRAALADSNTKDSQALSEELNRKSTDVSGVNMDEELSNMIIFQNAYSASARLLNTAKEMFDTILQIV